MNRFSAFSVHDLELLSVAISDRIDGLVENCPDGSALSVLLSELCDCQPYGVYLSKMRAVTRWDYAVEGLLGSCCSESS